MSPRYLVRYIDSAGAVHYTVAQYQWTAGRQFDFRDYKIGV